MNRHYQFWVGFCTVLFVPHLLLAGGTSNPIDTDQAKFNVPINLSREQRKDFSGVRLLVVRTADYDLKRYMGDEKWTIIGQLEVAEGRVPFSAPGNGEYWFAVQIVRKDGALAPADLNALTPFLKVRVDSKR